MSAEKLESHMEAVNSDGSYNFVKVRDLARRFRVKQQIILDWVEDSERLDLIVGGATYSGWFEHDHVGDYEVELYQ